jgi:hypothetical protein
MSVRALRALFIRKILDRRFGLDALQKDKTGDPEWWSSGRNEIGRNLYEEAMRERERLESATEVELAAMVLGDRRPGTP